MEFGCKLSPHDVRDFKLKATPAGAVLLPEEYICDLKIQIKNQKSVSSCVAHATSSILEHHANGEYELSTNFFYGGQKAICGRCEGKGMYLRDACKIAANYGDMLLEDCPGNTEVPNCYSVAEEALQDTAKTTRAKEFRISKYFSCSSIDEIKQAIYNHGPVLASYKWYNTFKVDKNGKLTGKQSGDPSYHAIMIYGYITEGFLCQNSWGKSWGKDGRFLVPYDIPVSEARGFVDLVNDINIDDIVEPKRNKILDILYKCINFILNLIKKKN